MANINRDYLIVLDAKSSVISEADELKYYITDEHSQNLFVNLVVRDIERINKYVEVHDPEKYQLELHIVKPNNDIVRPHLQANLLSVPDAIYAFELPKEAVDYIGTYKCELRVTYKETEETTVTTSNKFKYKVKRSIYNNLDAIQDAPQYPIVIQLFDKLSDINQYEEDRRANELARQLAEEQRQARFDVLDADVTDSIQAMDDKVVEVENRISAKEHAVDTLIADAKADIDNYKVAKDQEIDEYKTAKDTEINNAITAQDNKIDTAINAQNDRITVVENNDATQDNRLDNLENRATLHESRLTDVEAKNAEQDNRLDVAENRLANIGNDITNTMQPIIDEHTSRLDAIEAIDVAQNTRLDAIEAKNQQQDDRLLDIEKVNKRQDMNLKCLFAESKNNMIDVTEEGNTLYLQNSTTGYTLIDEIKGNTLVNYNKEPDKELILNGNINTSGDNTVTITEGVDGGLVDVALEGNTLVNVSKTKDSTAISMSYTVENSGNHVALQGDIHGSCRPVITGNTLVNIAKGSIATPMETTQDGFDSVEIIEHDDYVTYKMINASKVSSVSRVNWSLQLQQDLVEGKTYTVILPIPLNTHNGYFRIRDNTTPVNYSSPNGTTCWSFTATANGNSRYVFYAYSTNDYSVGDTVIFNMPKKIIILEGDWANKPIPDYFTGLQSTFEDNLVTQEMVDSGEEEVDNLGKYRVEYKVTGKNLFDGKTKNGYYSNGTFKVNADNLASANPIRVRPNTSYVGSGDVMPKMTFYDKDMNFLLYSTSQCNASPSNACYMNIHATRATWFQIEEGDTATAYEPYKEYTKTLYLNSPLLEGDTIEEKDDGIYHVHRSELVAYTEGDETSLITDKVNTLHQLSEPQYELIEQSNLVIPSYVNGHLDFNTAIPIEKVEFKAFSEELTYLYANTQYTVQFVADKATTIDITLGGTQLLAQSIVAGLNRITITTPETLVDNKLIIDGVGASISNVVVTDTDREFKYFEGMKSVGECEGNKIEILSRYHYVDYNSHTNQGHNTKPIWNFHGNVINDYLQYFNEVPNYHSCNNLFDYYYISNSTTLWINLGSFDPYEAFEILNIRIAEGEGKINKKEMTHEPLRAVGDYRDRYVLVDGKWHIERNCLEDDFNKYNNSWTADPERENFKRYYIGTFGEDFIVDNLPKITREQWIEYNTLGVYLNKTNKTIGIVIPKNSTISEYIGNSRIIYRPANYTPTYEEIDYNPFEVYSDITHISTNSTIPANITVKNHGYNCLLKPSTTYTISSNLGLNTVTTPSTLNEDCLRFMDTDTSDVTTMKDVLVLEGDWTTKADLIPANFSGIESAFEQEYDAEKGKYKVNAKVANEDKSKENNITFYINEPLRGIDDVKDRVYVKDDKVVVQRNYISVTFDGSDDEDWKTVNNRYARLLLAKKPKLDNNNRCKNYMCDTFKKSNNLLLESGIFINDAIRVKTEFISNAEEARVWFAKNPTTVVYQLAEPTYEEVEYNDVKLFIESFKNSTLSYNSNVPVTSKLYYSYSVPLVDTVAQTASISDEQDVMIIDLATQVAVMEMLLM